MKGEDNRDWRGQAQKGVRLFLVVCNKASAEIHEKWDVRGVEKAMIACRLLLLPSPVSDMAHSTWLKV